MGDTWWVGPEDLNDEQRGVIGLPLDGSHLVVGPPGSGKTNLLLLRANYMTLAGHANIAIVVYTKTLQQFIASGGQQYAFPATKIMTCRKWQHDLLYQYGMKVTPPDDFEAQRVFFVEQINELIARKGLDGIFDGILLDEAQDYLPGEVAIFRKLAKVLFAVADSRQKIYRTADAMDTLIAAVDEQHRLRFHYRSGTAICKLADTIAKDSRDYEALAGTCNYDEASRPCKVEHFRCASIDEEAQRIIERLSVQVKAYPDEFLGVVCPTNEALNRVWEEVAKSPIAASAVVQRAGEHAPFDLSKRIVVCTLHAAKGLEVRVLHIAGCEFLKKFPHQRNMAFTAVTRAKTSLSLYYSSDIPGYLEQALNTLKPLPDLPKLKDVFGRKK